MKKTLFFLAFAAPFAITLQGMSKEDPAKEAQRWQTAQQAAATAASAAGTALAAQVRAQLQSLKSKIDSETLTLKDVSNFNTFLIPKDAKEIDTLVRMRTYIDDFNGEFGTTVRASFQKLLNQPKLSDQQETQLDHLQTLSRLALEWLANTKQTLQHEREIRDSIRKAEQRD